MLSTGEITLSWMCSGDLVLWSSRYCRSLSRIGDWHSISWQDSSSSGESASHRISVFASSAKARRILVMPSGVKSGEVDGILSFGRICRFSYCKWYWCLSLLYRYSWWISSQSKIPLAPFIKGESSRFFLYLVFSSHLLGSYSRRLLTCNWRNSSRSKNQDRYSLLDCIAILVTRIISGKVYSGLVWVSWHFRSRILDWLVGLW